MGFSAAATCIFGTSVCVPASFPASGMYRSSREKVSDFSEKSFLTYLFAASPIHQ